MMKPIPRFPAGSRLRGLVNTMAGGLLPACLLLALAGSCFSDPGIAPVAPTEDLFDYPHLNAGGRLVEVELPGGIRTRLPKLPIEMGHHDFTLRMQPPALGEHTREVLAGIGLSEMEISHLEAEGVVKCAAPPSAVD